MNYLGLLAGFIGWAPSPAVLPSGVSAPTGPTTRKALPYVPPSSRPKLRPKPRWR